MVVRRRLGVMAYKTKAGISAHPKSDSLQSSKAFVGMLDALVRALQAVSPAQGDRTKRPKRNLNTPVSDGDGLRPGYLHRKARVLDLMNVLPQNLNRSAILNFHVFPRRFLFFKYLIALITMKQCHVFTPSTKPCPTNPIPFILVCLWMCSWEIPLTCLASSSSQSTVHAFAPANSFSNYHYNS